MEQGEQEARQLYQQRLAELTNKLWLGTNRINDAEEKFSKAVAGTKLDDGIISSIENAGNALLYKARVRNDYLWVQSMHDAGVSPQVILQVWDLTEKLRGEAREITSQRDIK